jgi:hypothetical protein
MNWTGGTLQRTKHANKGVVQKQKAYFARARTHLQNGSNPTIAPFRPSYLQNDDSFELAGRLPSFGSGSVRHTGHSARRHREARDREPSPNDDSHEPGEYAQADIEYDMAEASNRPAQFSKSPRRMATGESCQSLSLVCSSTRDVMLTLSHPRWTSTQTESRECR